MSFLTNIGIQGAAGGAGNMFNFGNPFGGLTSSAVNTLAPILSGNPLGSLTNIGASANPVQTSGLSSINWTDLFLRAVVIILGFIFVAVGLTMFNSAPPITIQNVSRGTKSIGKKVIGK